MCPADLSYLMNFRARARERIDLFEELQRRAEQLVETNPVDRVVSDRDILYLVYHLDYLDRLARRACDAHSSAGGNNDDLQTREWFEKLLAETDRLARTIMHQPTHQQPDRAGGWPIDLYERYQGTAPEMKSEGRRHVEAGRIVDIFWDFYAQLFGRDQNSQSPSLARRTSPANHLRVKLSVR